VRRRVVRIAVVLVALAAVGVGVWRLAVPAFRDSGPDENSTLSAQNEPPTIVLIMTDDQRWDTVEMMPTVRHRLLDKGVTFINSFVVDPLCCPSRASTLTGRYPHSTGVWANSGLHGGFHRFRDRSTIATWLQARGYTTGLFGKYLNRYEKTMYIPPGWDRWVAFEGSDDDGGFYYRYKLNIDGRVKRFGRRADAYSTNVIAERAVSFIRSSHGPLLVYFAPSAPHAPAAAGPEDVGSLPEPAASRPASYNEEDVSDKPAWVRALPRLSSSDQADTDRQRRDMLASLLPVDRAVGRILDALAETDRLRNSMIVFTSDNGFSLGEHRWVGKAVPWEESIRVPLIVRYDPMIRAAHTDGNLALNIDLAPTFAQLAGARAPRAEGRSLVPLLQGKSAGWRSHFAVEGMGLREMPSYCALRTTRYLFVAYSDGDAELYDLNTDPLELENLASDPALEARITQFEDLLRDLCRPPPPGSPPGFPP
jgi:N-acetylglucosamine-6-sulfatase